MRRTLDKHNNFGTIWSVRTRNFHISLIFEESFESYDGEDPGREIQTALDFGDMVMFDSKVVVECCVDGTNLIEIGADYLGASVYRDGETAQFIHDGYFRDMLATACDEARKYFAKMPRLRAAGMSTVC